MIDVMCLIVVEPQDKLPGPWLVASFLQNYNWYILYSLNNGIPACDMKIGWMYLEILQHTGGKK